MVEISVRVVKGVIILDISGNIDIDSSVLVEKIGWCLDNGYYDILCNFESVNLVDYTGLAALAIAYKNVVNHKGRMKFVNLSASIQKVFSMVCMDRVFEIYENEELAVNSFEEDKAIGEIKKKQLRRRFKRLPLDIDVAFKGNSESEFRQGKVLNLSAVGMLVFSDKVYPLNEIVEARLKLLPDPGQLDIYTKVVWLVQKELQPQIYPAMGLEFYQLDSVMQEKIAEFVERNLPLNCSEQE